MGYEQTMSIAMTSILIECHRIPLIAKPILLKQIIIFVRKSDFCHNIFIENHIIEMEIEIERFAPFYTKIQPIATVR